MMDFEDGIDKNWTLSSSEAFGMHHVVEEHSPYAGDKHLLLEGWAFDMYSTNEASLHLDLAGENRVVLDFWWKEFNDENDVLDGVYISDDNGQSFVKIFSLTGTNSWQRTVLDLDYYIDLNSMSYNNNFIIKFQQYDDQDAPDDGLAFDNIQVYSQYSSIPYSCGFENDLDDYWTTESSNIHGRVQVTTYNNPHSGNKHLTMDVDSLGNNAINRAYLFLNLEDMNNVELGFYWKDYEYSCYSVPGVRFGGYRVSGVVDTSIPDTRYR
jgi:hypothetical protein